MADGANPAPPAAGDANNANGGGGLSWTFIARALLLWWGFGQLGRLLQKPAPPSDVTDNTPGTGLTPSSKSPHHSTTSSAWVTEYGLPAFSADGNRLPDLANIFQNNQSMTLRVYYSKDERDFSSFDGGQNPIWEVKGLQYASEDPPRSSSFNITPDEDLLGNGTAYLHIVLTAGEPSSNPTASASPHLPTIHKVAPLVTFIPPAEKKKGRKLLESGSDYSNLGAGEGPEGSDSDGAGEGWIPHWKPEVTLTLLHDFERLSRTMPPPPHMLEFVDLDPQRQGYLPKLWVNDFWVLKKDYIQINDTQERLPLTIHFAVTGRLKFELLTSWQFHIKQQAALGLQKEKDFDEIKRMVLETNPWLLGTTFIVTILHSVFDMLAFKNDISFWRKNKSMEGLSLRSLLMTCVFQTVIFLYLLDNDTSYMVLISNGIGLLIEYWKLTKAVNVSVDRTGRLIPKLRFTAKASYKGTRTEEYDRIATVHLSYAMYPAMVGYALYSLAHMSHKGWYSWIISSLVGFIYLFGFIMMTPQLYLNYRLKSVAHLPWRAMVYKSLNTFIDDLFAFIITMPWMHRLSCLRDDLIFFIFLYQKWIYPVDKSRINEFGVTGEEYEEHVEKKTKKEKPKTS